MSSFANMTKHFSLGSGRVFFTQKKGAIYKINQDLRDGIEQSLRGLHNREMGFIRPRYEEAQNALCEIHTNPQLKFRHHIGGGYYISVSADFKCVDIR